MNVLILGGTQFIGRHTVEAALAAGHRVSVFNRGQSPDELPAEIERLRGDRDQGKSGLTALMGRQWDACVDVSGYLPQQVRASAELLSGQVGRYVYISSRAVYAEPCPLPITEQSALQAPAAEDITEINGETYGPLKVACEQIVQALYPDACTILRPQIVVGPHDANPRYPYWAVRAARGGVMLAPGDGSDHLQVADVRDVSRFVLKVIADGRSGVFNLAGPRLIWADFLRRCGATDVHWVDADTLKQALLDTEELSLYVADTDPQAGRMNVSFDRAIQAGFTLTAPEVTARDTRTWWSRQSVPFTLTPEREVQVLSRLDPT
ncbi:NAD-dependent epimerase/dehydratase family protein [Deinococcus psychrotolerans]|uniref:NAD-dependent epimerase/dehydratase family protein n=1 Tax=Deinococcus psychrotolerans TaxID=2489213 RepID=A0A3G8YMV7_9DEIO|nr:NAD-dependent epimerase/dehydratase family protein [Deinococcus psychrotolerans]AZI42921.1 NAD-dependent epimerase/dehydratase family protein [Deinococcus psychrotolerans]